MSTSNATRPTGRTLPPEDSGYVKKQLVAEIRLLLVDQLDDAGQTDNRLGHLICDLEDELERIEHADQLDREHRTRLHNAAAALREHLNHMAATSDSIMRLADTINSGWYDVEEEEALSA